LGVVGNLSEAERAAARDGARELDAFSDDELAQYRAELAAAPADDPPSPTERHALALVLASRSTEAIHHAD